MLHRIGLLSSIDIILLSKKNVNRLRNFFNDLFETFFNKSIRLEHLLFVALLYIVFFAYAPMEKPRRISAVFLSISVLQGLVTVNVPHLPVT